MSCPNNCIHAPFSEKTIKDATEVALKVRNQKGENNPTTLNLNDKRDVIGYIAQAVSIAAFEHMGLVVEASNYFDPDRHSDFFDFIYKDKKIDVKGGTWPIRKLLISDTDRSKLVDVYLFVVVDLAGKVAHLVGWLAYEEFWKISHPANYGSPCHQVSPEETDPIIDLL